MEALIYDNMKKLGITKNYAKYQSIKAGITRTVFAISALASSYLILFGYNVVIIATIVFSFLTSAVVTFTLQDTHKHDEKIQKLNQDYFKILKKGFIYSFKHTTIFKFILFIVLMDSFIMVIDNYAELILFHITNNLSLVPILIAIESIIGATLQVVITRFLQKKKIIIPILILLFSFVIMILGFVYYNFSVTFTAYVLFWGGVGIACHLLNTKKQLLIPSKIRATVNSVEGFLYGIFSVIYFLTFGKLVKASSYQNGFISISVFTLFIGVVFLFVLGFDKHLRKKEARI